MDNSIACPVCHSIWKESDKVIKVKAIDGTCVTLTICHWCGVVTAKEEE